MLSHSISERVDMDMTELLSCTSCRAIKWLKFSANDLSYISTCATMKIGEDCPEGISFSKGCMYIARWVSLTVPKFALFPVNSFAHFLPW